MIPIQEIDFFTDGNIKFSTHIIVPNSNSIGAEVIIYDPRVNTICSTLHTLGAQQDLEHAFEKICEFCINYAKGASLTVNRINNPCNTEFIDQTQQQNVVKNILPNITIKVNE